MHTSNDNPSHKPLKILVIGAGIAGLSAAIALGKQGHEVVILEKSKFAKETGAAIHLPPNCTALLKWMNVDPTTIGGTLLREIHRYDMKGDLKFRNDFSDVREKWQAEWYLVHRVDLHNCLKQRASETATLHKGCTIVRIDIDKSLVVLSDGREFTADVLLGADGAHSVFREHVSPSTPAPHPTGKSCVRWLLPMDKLKSFDSKKDPGVFTEWATEDRRIVAYPCANNTIFNLCAFLPSSEAAVPEKGDWQAATETETLVNAFNDCSEVVQEIILQAKDAKCWGLYDMEDLSTWSKGCATLLGDAAHPFQPYMGQGGAMAIEDAVCIATLLPPSTTIERVPSRLKLYEKARRPRVEEVLRYTRMNGRDENDKSQGARMTPADMVRFMNVLFSHNEIIHSSKLLAAESST